MAFNDPIFQKVVFKQKNKATQGSRKTANQKEIDPKALSWEWCWHVHQILSN